MSSDENMIDFDDFKKLDIQIGTIISAETVPDADKLLKLTVDMGQETRQIMSGIVEFFPDPSVLVGQQVPILINLKPRKFRGYESQGMMLAADEEGKPVLLHPAKKVDNGSIIC